MLRSCLFPFRVVRPELLRNAPRRLTNAVRLLSCTGLLLAGVLLTGCGSKRHPPPPPPFEGEIVLENRTDLTTNELVLTFYIAAFGQPFTDDLLGLPPLVPLEARSMGIWPEDYYDAEADLELGDVVEWFDLFVGLGDTTVYVAE